MYTSPAPIGNLALEMAVKSDRARVLIAENFENWRIALRQCLIEAADRLPPDADADRIATFILTVMEGGVMQARAYKSIAPFDASVATLRDYVDRLLATTKSKAARKKAGQTKRKKTKRTIK